MHPNSFSARFSYCENSNIYITTKTKWVKVVERCVLKCRACVHEGSHLESASRARMPRGWSALIKQCLGVGQHFKRTAAEFDFTFAGAACM